MTSIDLEAIRERESHATEGPWTYGGQGWVFASALVPDDGRSRGMRDLLADVHTSDDDALFIAHARADIPALLEEVDRLRGALAGEIMSLGDRQDWADDRAEIERLHSERDQAREECGHEKHMRKFVSEELDRFIAAKRRAEAERDEVSNRMSKLVRALTGGRISDPGHNVQAAVTEIEALYERFAEEDRAELQAEFDRLVATLDRVRAACAEHWEYQTRREAKFGRTGSSCLCPACKVMRALEGTDS